MAYEIGTATDYKDLLNKLKVFVSTNAALVAAGQQWTVLRHTTPTGAAHELIIRGPGLAGLDQIYVGIRTEEVVGNGIYNWMLCGLTGYAPAADMTGQPGIISSFSSTPRLLLTNGGLYYWFFANGRRIIVVVRAGTTYQIGYLGLILPYGPPANLPYPLFIGGCGFSQVPWSDSAYPTVPFFRAALSAAPSGAYYTSGQALLGTWRSVLHKYTYSYGNELAVYELFIWPYIVDIGSTNAMMFKSLKRPADGSCPTFPMLLCSAAPDKNVYGEFDGMLALPGVGFVPEDTLTIGSDQYLVVSGGRLTDVLSFVAIKME